MLIGSFIIPAQVLLIPLFFLLKTLGLIDTYLAIILPYVGILIPIATLILRSFFQEIPRELKESAKIDGASDLKIFLRVVLPLSKPALGSCIILLFLETWNEFIFALVFLHSPQAADDPGRHREDRRRQVPPARRHVLRIHHDYGNPDTHRVHCFPEVVHRGHHHGCPEGVKGGARMKLHSTDSARLKRHFARVLKVLEQSKPVDKNRMVERAEFQSRLNRTQAALAAQGVQTGLVFSDEHYCGDVPYLGGNTNITVEQVAGVVGRTGFHIMAGLEGGYVAEQLAPRAGATVHKAELLQLADEKYPVEAERAGGRPQEAAGGAACRTHRPADPARRSSPPACVEYLNRLVRRGQRRRRPGALLPDQVREVATARWS